MAKSMTAQLLMFDLMTSEGSHRCISSPALADGHSLPVSQDGLTIGRSGPDLVPVSHSRSQGGRKARKTSAISGPSSSASSVPAGHPSLSESKSQQLPEASARGKVCKTCQLFKSYGDFYANKKGRTRASCKDCSKAEERSRKAGTKPQRSASFKKWRQKNRASVLISAAKYRARQNNLPFDLDDWRPQIEARLAAGKCEMTGLPLDMSGGRTWDSPSLDRINPAEGYVISNVRVVLFALNVMMNTWGAEKIHVVADALRTKADTFQTRFQKALERRLSRIGSTECSLTWKASVTPAGRPLSRLVPSMRPIDEIDCGLWRTPNQRDGKGAYTDPEAFRRRLENGHQLNLNDEVRMALWPTPMAHEARLGYQRRPPDKKGSQKSLTTEATDALGFGDNVNGSQDTTEKPGALNPAFAFWLMGFPPEWESCAPPAMPSSRKLRPK